MSMLLDRPNTASNPETMRDWFPYETEPFHRCWWMYLAPRFEIPLKNRDLLIHHKAKFKGLLKLKELRISGWNNAWAQDLTEARVHELIEMDRTAGWDIFRMTWMEARAHHQAFDQLKAAGYPLFHLPAPPQHVIDLTNGVDGWLQKLSHNGRKAIKKKVRRAETLCPRLETVTEAEDIAPFFEELFTHHRRYWREKTGSSYLDNPEERAFILHWAQALHADGHVVLERLLMQDETVNLSMAIGMGDTFYWLLTINTGAHADAVPGLVGLYLRAQEAAQRGVTCFNMGAGDYFYKIQSANYQQLCHELVVCNPRSWKGRLYAARLKAAQKIRRSGDVEAAGSL